MRMRKINAGLSLVTVLLLLDHTIFNAARMISQGAIEESAPFMPRLMSTLMLVHVIISIGLAISAHSKTEKGKGRLYPKLNVSTMVQRISGVLVIIFTPLHILGAQDVIQTPPAVHAVVPPLFFLLVMAHAAVSTSKAFITLGIGSARFVKCADIVIKVVCVATLIASIIGFYLFEV